MKITLLTRIDKLFIILLFALKYSHRHQTSGCSGCRCTRCFFSLVVQDKSQILINKSRILTLHPLFSGPFGTNEYSYKNKQIFLTLNRPEQANRIGYVIHFYVGNLSPSIILVWQ